MKRIVKNLTLVCTALALLALGAISSSASVQAADAKPVVLVSLAGYEALKQDLAFVGELSGMPKLGNAAEGFLAAVTQGNGLDGLDKKKPIGAAVFIGESGLPSGFVFIPVEDADKLLESLQTFVVDIEDLGEGYSTFKLKDGPTLTMRESKTWIYVSMSKELLADVPADPSKLLGDLPKNYDVAVQLDIANLPPQLIETAIAQMRVGAEQAMKKTPVDDDEATAAFRKAFTEQSLEQLAQGLKDLDSYTIGLAIDDKTRSVYLDVDVEMKDGSKLAKQLNAAADNAKRSKLPGLADVARVFNFHINAPIDGDDAKQTVKLLEDGRKLAAEKIDEKGDDEEARKLQKKVVDTAIDVAIATLEEGQVNGGAVVTGDGPFSIVAAIHLTDAKKLEKVLKEVIGIAKNDPNAPEIEVDAETKSGITYHTLAIPEIDDEEQAENAEKFFGTDELTLTVGFGEKTLVIAVGDDPIEAADSVVTAKPTSVPSPATPLLAQLRVGPVLKMAAEQDDKDEKKQAALKVITESLAGSDKDHINLTALLIKNGERVRFEIEEGLIAAFGKAVVAASKGAR